MTSYLLHPFRSLRLGLVLIFTLLMAATSWGTLSEVYYLDENGIKQSITDYSQITKNTTTLGGTENGGEYWYVVSSSVKIDANVISITGSNVHIILLDDVSLECNIFSIPESKTSLFIYAGNSDRNKTISGSGVLLFDNGIQAEKSSVTVNGGHVTTGDGKDKARLIAALYFYFNGGNVDVEKIQAQTLTLAWQNRTDSFKAKSIRGTLSIKENFFFKDENGELYSGYNISTSSVVGKTLTPYLPPVSYIDENGNEQSVAEYTLLTNDIAKADMDGIITLKDGWYVVPKTNLADTYFDDVTLSFEGDAHIIIEDGAELKAVAYDRTVIQSSGNLTFYAQKLGTGKLTAYDSSETNSTILAHKEVTFNGGIVTVRNGHAAGRTAVKIEYYPGKIYINSGIVNISSNTDAEEPEYTLKVYNVILDWRSAKDRYTLGSADRFSIADGKTFKEENGKICHRYEFDNAFKDKPIVPCYIVYIDNQDGLQPKETIASFDENGEAHVTKPEDPTRVGTTFVGWAATKEGSKVFDWSAPISGHTTAYAIWDDMKPVEYVDEDGKTQKVTEYFLLTSDIGEPDENHYLRFTGGWYVVQGEETFSSDALNALSFSDDVHLILADGAKLNVEAQNMYFDALYIHTQSRGTGSFNAKKLGIYENLCIYGGNFTFDEIAADGDGATINGGNINVGRIYAYDLVVNGGSVDASLMEGWSVTLGWNSTDDHITAEELRIAASSPSMAIDIAKGKAFKDEDGNIYDEPVPIDFYGSSLSGKMLTPLKWITSEDIVVDDIAIQAYTGNPVCPDVVVKDGKKTLKVKTDYTVECFENVEKSSTAPYVKITGMGNYRGDIEKHFAILERTADFASVGIFKDEDGHSIAAIDANYGEDGTVNIDEEITVDSVKFERSFTKESRSTIVLPFSVSTSQIKGLKQVLAFSKIVVEDGQKAVGMHVVWENTSSEHVTLNAYTPYIVLMDGDKFDIKGSVTLEVTRDAVDNGTNKSSEWEFRGSLTYKKWEEGNPELGSIYGFAGNADKKTGVEVGDFVKAAAGAWVNPMRAYLVKKPSASAVRANGAIAKTATTSSIDELPASMRIVIIDDEETEEEHTTVIGQHNVRTTPYRVNFMPHTYDLKGRIVGNGKKARGAYYGKKFVK